MMLHIVGAGHAPPLQHPQIYFIPYSANIPAHPLLG